MSVRRTTASGFTLVEAMIVIAIVGVLSALAITAIANFTHVSRVNTSSSLLARALADVRLRSMTQHCPHIAQINGFAYAPGGGAPAGAPNLRGTVSIIRKANCASTVLFFEVGDKVLSTANLGDTEALNQGVQLFVDVPAGLVPGDNVTTTALSVAYRVDGTRALAKDAGGGTFLDDAATGTLDLRFAQLVTDQYKTVVRIPSPTGVATRQ